jgi:Asp-tRNA(Asn)/Glu-tRNA(Gln) amidotransferase B subunit
VSLAEKLIKDFEELPETQKREVVDFVEFLKIKNQKKLESMMDEVIFENKEALEELAK